MACLRLLLAALLALGALMPLVAADGGRSLARKKLKTVTRTDVQAQSGQDVQVENLVITAAPFAFVGVGKLKTITRVTFEVTLDDADTGTGDADNERGELTLELDEIDTGILLDGFGSGENVNGTVSGKPANAKDILRALKDDGELVATIRDSDPTDPNSAAAPANFFAELVLIGKQPRKKK
jgi:hypothetical protein